MGKVIENAFHWGSSRRMCPLKPEVMNEIKNKSRELSFTKNRELAEMKGLVYDDFVMDMRQQGRHDIYIIAQVKKGEEVVYEKIMTVNLDPSYAPLGMTTHSEDEIWLIEDIFKPRQSLRDEAFEWLTKY